MMSVRVFNLYKGLWSKVVCKLVKGIGLDFVIPGLSVYFLAD